MEAQIDTIASNVHTINRIKESVKFPSPPPPPPCAVLELRRYGVSYLIPVPGMPTLLLTPLLPNVTFAPLGPTETLAPRFPRFKLTPGAIRIRLKNLKPIYL